MIFYMLNIKKYAEQLKCAVICIFNENLIYTIITPKYFDI